MRYENKTDCHYMKFGDEEEEDGLTLKVSVVTSLSLSKGSV